jgi:hypothetical protein
VVVVEELIRDQKHTNVCKGRGRIVCARHTMSFASLSQATAAGNPQCGCRQPSLIRFRIALCARPPSGERSGGESWSWSWRRREEEEEEGLYLQLETRKRVQTNEAKSKEEEKEEEVVVVVAVAEEEDHANEQTEHKFNLKGIIQNAGATQPTPSPLMKSADRT